MILTLLHTRTVVKISQFESWRSAEHAMRFFSSRRCHRLLAFWLSIIQLVVRPCFSSQSDNSMVPVSVSGIQRPHGTMIESSVANIATVKLRLFLVRHGETEANAKRIVVGQADSVRARINVSVCRSLTEKELLACSQPRTRRFGRPSLTTEQHFFSLRTEIATDESRS